MVKTPVIDVLCALIAAASAVLCAVVSTKNSARNKKMEHRAELRSKENRLMLDMIHANTQLTIGTAMAIKNGRANGEMTAGLEAVKNSDEKYQAFLEEIAIEHLTK